MKISTLNLLSVKQYLRIDTDEDDELLGGIMDAAVGLIVSLTGLSAEAVRDISESILTTDRTFSSSILTETKTIFSENFPISANFFKGITVN